MLTGIALERDTERSFAIHLTIKPGLPEEIRRDDIRALREDQNRYFDEYLNATREIEIRLTQAQADGFNTKGW